MNNKKLFAILVLFAALVLFGCTQTQNATGTNTQTQQNNSQIVQEQQSNQTQSPSDAQSQTAGDLTVIIQNFSFNPSTITVPKGSTVIWNNFDGVQHTVTADDGLFDSGYLGKGITFSYTFNTPGTYTYHCIPHPNMKGTIIVQ